MRRHRLGAVLVLALLAASCGRSDEKGAATATTTKDSSACAGTPLQATEIGVTEDSITVEVMADVGSSLAPGLFQANVDAMDAFAAHVNATGGIGCRKLIVKTWDSKLNADESKNGLIDACANAVAMVGGNSLFNPDVSPLATCKDRAGATTGLPDVAALANDVNEQCNPTTFTIQVVAETCPVKLGAPRPLKAIVGPTKWFVQQFPGLHGLFLVPGDLPTTVQSATYQIAGQEDAGITFDGTPKVSGRDEQAAFIPKVQALKTARSTYVFNGSGDRALISLRKESEAQGVDSVKVWACSLGCYKQSVLADRATEGTYVWMQFLPFEERSANEELAAYVDAVSLAKADSFGVQAWQAAVAFKEVVDRIVEADGPNAITRTAILAGLADLRGFDANGSMGAKDLKGVSPCFLIMQVKDGAFVRVHPTKVGTFDCDPGNVITETLDPAAEAAKIK